MTDGRVYIGIATGPADPAVAAVRDGRVIAYVEEERLIRDKHAVGKYPIRALDYCLEAAGVALQDVAAVSVGWDCAAYTDGRMASFYRSLAEDWNLDHATKTWQEHTLKRFSVEGMREFHHRNWRRRYGNVSFPRVESTPHHFTHAFQAAMESPFKRAVVLTIDGSGDSHTVVVWLKSGGELRPLREILMPHSLGWFYAAFTEYLGFDAYDGEYKVMGLAAFGRPDAQVAQLVAEVLAPAPDAIEFRLDPSFIHHGAHTWSDRYTDKLVDLLGPPRRPTEEVTDRHIAIAFAVQNALEEAVCRLARWAVAETGVHNVCVGGGVGHNVKMNSRLLQLPEIDQVFAHPLCGDGGAAAGTALVQCFRESGALPPPLEELGLGPQEDEATVVAVLTAAGVAFERPADLFATVSADLARGRVVGWCQGRLEAGPRALGHRSIIADPRSTSARDRVNAAIKHREMWRPFGPAMLADAAGDYLDGIQESRFMTLAFPANEKLAEVAPAIVHQDGTCRVQLVHPGDSARFHDLLTAFAGQTGVPVLLNTSFNIKGEPIVNSTEDALRTFWSTGLDVLVLGDLVVRKPRAAR